MAICAVCRRRRHYVATAAAGRAARAGPPAANTATAAAAALVWPEIYSSINDVSIKSEALIGRILGRPEPHPDGYGRGPPP
jgi:hypothetical protein